MGFIHDKKSQEENGDFPRPDRMPPVVKKLTTMCKLPALPGDSQSLTFPGV